MIFKMMASKNDAEALLATHLLAAGTSFAVPSGSGALYPVGYTGVCTSAGDSTTLNRTGIQAELAAKSLGVGSFIKNVTTGYTAVIRSISTNQVITSPLESGVWGDTNECCIGAFNMKLQTKDSAGKTTKFEKVLVKYVDNDNDIVYIEARAQNGTTAQEWTTSDYASLVHDEDAHNGLKDAIGTLFEHIYDIFFGVVTFAGNKTFSGNNTHTGTNDFSGIVTVPEVPSLDGHAASKAYVDLNSGGGVNGVPSTMKLTVFEDVVKTDPLSVYNLATFAETTNLFLYIGYATSYHAVGFALIGNGVSMSSINLALQRNSTVSDNLIVRIETDSGGEPSGTLVDANATATVTGSTISTSKTDTTINFAGSFTIPNNQKVWLVCERSGAYSTSNYYKLYGADYGGCGTGFREDNAGTFYFSYAGNRYYASATGIKGGGLIKNVTALNSGNTLLNAAFAGFPKEAYSAGDEAEVIFAGVIDGLVSLKPLQSYYIDGDTLVARTSSGQPAILKAIDEDRALLNIMFT